MSRAALRAATAATIAFLHLPILVIVLYAFNADRALAWPIRAYTLSWFQAAWENGSVRDAIVLSIQAGVGSMVIALVLGSLAAFAVHRYAFFGRSSLSFLLVLPLALPGIVTGIALNATINTLGLQFSLATIIVGHATFCVVVVYNNVVARLRRSSASIEEASADLGATPLQTFRFVTLPVIRTALLAGGLLAFALSFDEIIVTTFTAGTAETLPIWILDHLAKAPQRPIVNVVAVFVILLSAIPVYVASRISQDSGGLTGSA